MQIIHASINSDSTWVSKERNRASFDHRTARFSPVGITEIFFRMLLYLLLVATLCCVAQADTVIDRPCNRRNFSDGCTDPLRSDDGGDFAPACDRHDVCYRCGVVYSVSKATCDENFGDLMTEICYTQRAWYHRPMCYVRRRFYLALLRWVGKFSYVDNVSATSAVCQRRWIPTCLPVTISSGNQTQTTVASQ